MFRLFYRPFGKKGKIQTLVCETTNPDKMIDIARNRYPKAEKVAVFAIEKEEKAI